jgi:ADP-heptose:LPS heptosyltransferase
MNVKDALLAEIQTLLQNDEIRNKNVVDWVIGFLFEDGHIHDVTPDNTDARMSILEALLEKYHIVKPQEVQKAPEQVIFHNRQAIGDILTMTAAIRDFKSTFPQTRVGVSTTAMHIWDHNPYIDHSFRDQKQILKIGPTFLTNKSNMWNLHMCNAFRLDIENKLHLSIPQGPITPDIWMTEEEYNRPPLIEGPYWVFIYGGEPGWPTKQYHKWQEVINLLREDITIVQLGVSNHPYPVLNGCVNYIGKTEDRNTGIRDLFNIFLHSQGSLGLVSMHMHLSAAFGNPCVVVAAAREPAWFTQYFGHQYVQTNGTMFCSEHKACWACKLEGCRNKTEMDGKQVPKCVSIIEPEEVAEAVRKYYKGGRLEYGKKIPNTYFKNIQKEAKIFVAPKVEEVDQKHLENFGFKWGGGCITDRDWMFMKDIIQEENVKTVLEFGAGLSTLLMGTLVDRVKTFETMQGWIQKIKSQSDPNKNEFYLWDGKNLPITLNERFDMAFVDGPSGGENREWSTKIASELADVVIVHDAGRKPEREWQEKHLKPNFELVAKGGHRCHYWKRKDKIKKEKPCCDMITDKPVAKMITTCRGYGGSERSTIEIMGMLQEKGYHVQLAPTGNVSWEYKKNIPNGVQLVPFTEIYNPVDIAVFYTSDTIWNFNQDMYTKVMPGLSAKRKVMVLNFKIGGAGTVPWTLGWDKYLFLNSEHEAELLKRIPSANTVVMAPPTDLKKFFGVDPNYNLPLNLIRHNSQGDNKHHPDTNYMIQDILRLSQDIQFHFMPARSDCIDLPQVHKYKKNEPPVWEFLKSGNCFWYRLPDGYTEGGPKVIMEAMASGLACITDNHSGMKDRVTQETGWLCNSWQDYINAVKEILENPTVLKIKGQAARKRAMEVFDRYRWAEEIIG